MARLECTLQEVTAQGHEPATMVEFVGSVDPDTLAIFEDVMDKLIDSQRVRVIFNMAKLKYINSTGMGMSVQFADQLSEENGGLVFMKVPPKVLLVIEMLGLQELFQIVSSEEQALAALSGGDVGPASIEVKLAEEEVPVIEEAVILVDAPEPVIEAPAFEGGGQPQVVKCPVCDAHLSTPGKGAYRCPRCRSALEVDESGIVQGYPEPTKQVAELTLPADENYFAGAGWMINMAGLKAGLTEEASQTAAASAEGCLKLLTSASLNGSKEDNRLHLFVRSGEGRLSVRIYCGGSALGSAGLVDPYRSGVDRLEYMASAEGNLITLEKSV